MTPLIKYPLQNPPPVPAFHNAGMNVDELSLLSWLATLAGGNILEIGTSYGHTAAVLSRVTRRLVVTVDIPHSRSHQMHPSQRRESLPDDQIGSHCMHCNNVASLILGGDTTLRSAIDSCNPRLVIIDGDHSMSGVRSDTECVVEHARGSASDILVAWHDYYEHPEEWISVKRYVDSLSQSGLRCRTVERTCLAFAIFKGADGARPVRSEIRSTLQLG